MNGFSTNDVTSHLHICDQLIITVSMRGLCLLFSNSFHVDSLYKFRRTVVDKVKIEVYI